jgi:hypothetical protein
MAETYSQSATIGLSAGSPFAAIQRTTQFRQDILPDSTGTPILQLQAMQTGKQILCLMPDGSQKFFTIDAERSQPGAMVLVAVGP